MSELSQEITFRVYGALSTKGSYVLMRRGDKQFPVDSNANANKKFDRLIRQAWADVYEGEPLDELLECELTFWIRRPKKPKFPDGPGTAPDVDKLQRTVFDGMQPKRATKKSKAKPGMIRDDARIVRVVAEKRYADSESDEGVTVTVRPFAGIL